MSEEQKRLIEETVENLKHLDKGNKITRKAFSDTQASAIINRLLREGCTEIGIKEENHTEGEK